MSIVISGTFNNEHVIKEMRQVCWKYDSLQSCLFYGRSRYFFVYISSGTSVMVGEVSLNGSVEAETALSLRNAFLDEVW